MPASSAEVSDSARPASAVDCGAIPPQPFSMNSVTARLEAVVEVLAALGEDEQREERLAVELDRPARHACGGRVGRRRGREIDGRVSRPRPVARAEAQAGQLGAPAAQRRPERRPELRQAVADVRRRAGPDPLDGGRERAGRDHAQRPRGHGRRRRRRRGSRGRRRPGLRSGSASARSRWSAPPRCCRAGAARRPARRRATARRPRRAPGTRVPSDRGGDGPLRPSVRPRLERCDGPRHRPVRRAGARRRGGRSRRPRDRLSDGGRARRAGGARRRDRRGRARVLRPLRSGEAHFRRGRADARPPRLPAAP